MILLVGLGNPGKEYAQTRHNAGFMAVDEIVHRYSFDGWTKKFKGEVCTGTIDGEKVLVLKPHTYMNLSGEAVLAATSFYKISPDKIYVFHDDMDLPVGRIKVKQGGGSGGGYKHVCICACVYRCVHEYVHVYICMCICIFELNISMCLCI